jgi:hypothetical protein
VFDVVKFDMVVLLLSGKAGCGRPDGAGAERGAKGGRGYSAAMTTTATTRDAAQIDCAALGEQKLKAG